MLIRCSECGRTISDKAAVCVGCGAPVTGGIVDESQSEPRRPPPTGRQLLWRAFAFVAALALGIAWSAMQRNGSAGAPWTSTVAALLVVVGLCGTIVTAVQVVSLRK